MILQYAMRNCISTHSLLLFMNLTAKLVKFNQANEQ